VPVCVIGNDTSIPSVSKINIDTYLNKDFNMIVMGDFNDHDNDNFWENFNPLINSKHVNIKTLTVNLCS
jgi:hypothetical protein